MGGTASAGTSGTPLDRKLGLRAGQRVLFAAMPADLAAALRRPDFAACEAVESAADIPAGGPLDVAHVFVTGGAALAAALPRLKARLDPAGMIWVSWPKRASGRPTDLTEDRVREAALALGLVDVKVCAVDAVWSGLKLVVPRRDRPSGGASRR